ncbi:MAG: hypothetical protein HFE46_00510 [Clostridia bacterium]|nr:hypothetical protein [Clostridia bacterium]
MKKISSLFDTLLTFAALFLLSCVTAGYFVRSTPAVLASACTFTFAVLFFTGIFSRRRRKPKEKQKKLNELRNKFLFSPPDYALDFTEQAVRKKCEPKRQDGFILSDKTAFCVCLTPEKVRTAFLAERYAAAARLGVARLVFLSAYGAEEDAAQTVEQLREPAAEIWDWEKVYEFFASLGCPPTQTLTLAAPAKQRSRAIRNAFVRRNARRYLFAAIVTLLFARFMPYGALYVIIASLSLVAALVCRTGIAERRKAKKKP